MHPFLMRLYDVQGQLVTGKLSAGIYYVVDGCQRVKKVVILK